MDDKTEKTGKIYFLIVNDNMDKYVKVYYSKTYG